MSTIKASFKPSISIGVAAHKGYRFPDDSMYLPIHVGAALNQSNFDDMTGDDTGDNISNKNQFYSELTALYWLWKNNNSDIKGLVHYRRHLASEKTLMLLGKDKFSEIIGYPELAAIMENYDIVLPRKRKYYIESIYSHYAHTFTPEHLDLCRSVLVKTNPKYVPAWDAEMSSSSAHMFNMFVMRAEKMDDYCSFVFPVLFEMERKIDPRNYKSFNARYLGRVSELLMDPWLETKGYSFAELRVLNLEPVNWIRKGGAFLLAKARLKKYNKSF